RLLAAHRRVWYTSPLKALTNSKYQEFSEAFGAEHVGILTGDRKERADAPVIVGTTEVYRNQLFDALREGRELRADLVVMDEAHYLADEERGHVWEEAIILTPPRVRLLLLSATVGNAKEFAAWIDEVRGVRCDEAAAEAAFGLQQRKDERRDARREFLRAFVEQHTEIRKHRHTDTVVRGGVAAHHAGHLPAWKLAIEKLMSAGLLDAIFATA